MYSTFHLQNQFTYFIILASAIAGPMALSFDKKVAFYKKWKFLFPAMLLPALCYIIWDCYFTSIGIWSFNDKYISGIKLFNLPLEEVLFFFIVPYCCVFIYECLLAYFPRINPTKNTPILLKMMAFALLVTGIIFYKKMYTSWTFIGNAGFITIVYLFRNYFKSFNATSFLISYCVVLVPFLIVNGLLTAIPVVIYNNAENLGIRIYTIPVEDVFYGMLLFLMNIVIYEKLKTNNKPKSTSAIL